MYNRPRIIPVLSIQDGELVKTIQFKNPRYIGDPINTVKIFNDKGADELCILDITASKEGKEPDFKLLQEIANEAFMPMSYGGGITKIEHVKRIIKMGFEKVVFNTSFFVNSILISEAVDLLGSSGVVICLDIKKDIFGNYNCFINDGSRKINKSINDVIEEIKSLNVGELIINSINNDGMMEGFDYDFISGISKKLEIPVIAVGGCGSIDHIKKIINCGAHSIAASSFFIYYGAKKAVLISYPNLETFSNSFEEKP